MFNFNEAPWMLIGSGVFASVTFFLCFLLGQEYHGQTLSRSSRRMCQKLQMAVGNTWTVVPSGDVFHFCDPANGRIVGVVNRAGREATPLVLGDVTGFQATIEGVGREA